MFCAQSTVSGLVIVGVELPLGVELAVEAELAVAGVDAMFEAEKIYKVVLQVREALDSVYTLLLP